MDVVPDSIKNSQVYCLWCMQIKHGEDIAFDDYISKRLMSAGVPVKLASMTWDDVKPNPQLVEFKKACDSLKSGTIGRSVLLLGDPGTGKSMLAALCYRDAYATGAYEARNICTPDAIFITAERMFAKLKSREHAEENDEDFRNAGLLVIDDLGAEYSTEWTSATLDGIISTRHASSKDMILTSNYYRDELCKAIAPRLTDRLFEVCEVYEFRGESQRG